MKEKILRFLKKILRVYSPSESRCIKEEKTAFGVTREAIIKTGECAANAGVSMQKAAKHVMNISKAWNVALENKQGENHES